jgi:NDP-sugar pyrophosphorylase family protein
VISGRFVIISGVTRASENRELSRLCTAVIFCGGRATRLHDQLKGSPKALAVLHHQPYLFSLLKQIASAGLKEVVLCVSPFTKEIITTIRGGRQFGLNVQYSIDSGLQENANALWHARSFIYTPFAIGINGDTIFNVNFEELFRAHVRNKAIATLVASARTDQPHAGALEVSSDGTVVDLHEWLHGRKVFIEKSQFSRRYSNTGVYLFEADWLKRPWLPEHRSGKLEEGLLRSLASERKLHAFQNGSKFLLDIGTPERLGIARSANAEVFRFVAA